MHKLHLMDPMQAQNINTVDKHCYNGIDALMEIFNL